MTKINHHPKRYFDPDPAVRKMANALYEQVKDLPIVSPHGHVDPRILAEDIPFPDPAELFLIPDHYIFRMLYSQGIRLEDLGIPTVDGSMVETDHRRIWQLFAEHYYLFAATPTAAWLNYEFVEVFGIDDKLDGQSANKIFDQLQEKLQSAEFRPRALFDRFRIEVLSTTDAAADELVWHQQIRNSNWNGRVIPCFRPDAVINLRKTNWKKEIDRLSEVSRVEITSFKKFIQVLQQRRAYFKQMGATSTDQGVESAFTRELTDSEVEAIFQRALLGKATDEDAASFEAHMLIEMARMSLEDGLVMQIHAGSFRNHNQSVFNKFGADKGADIPVQTEYTKNLQPLLNKYGNDPRLTLIVFTLDESTYSRELAPLAGHYPAMKLGPAWWFHDSIEGMTRYRQRVMETAGIYNTVGFNDDTRAFPSIPARHDLSRRVEANCLSRLVCKHIIDEEEARQMMNALAYGLAKKAYKL